jgi:hypothetical protein
MKLLRWFFLFITAVISCNSFAENIEIHVLNGLTREKKTYVGSTYKFDIPIANVKGWNKCVAMPMKKFDFYGVSTIRGEIFCSSINGNTVGFSCVAQKHNTDVIIQKLFGPNFKIVDAETIHADGFSEITLACNNF